MAEPAAAVPRAPYKDRRVGLILFGILEVLIGLFFLLAMAFGALGSAMAGSMAGTLPLEQQAALAPRAMLPSLVFDLLLAVYFIWLGIGSMTARRWARALLLVSAWIWLVAGVIACLALLVVFPDLLGRALESGGAAAAAGAAGMAVVRGCLGAVLVFFYFLLPLFLVLFYRSPHVKATCEACDPRVRWTDRCPTPVLGLSLVLGLGAVGVLVTALYGVLPVFGRIVTGPPAAALAVLLALVLAALARAAYLLRPWAWWGVLGLLLVSAASSLMTLGSSISWTELYRDMGLPAAQIERLGLDRMLADPRLFWFDFVVLAASLIFLLRVRRWFRPAAASPRSGAAASDAGAAGG